MVSSLLLLIPLSAAGVSTGVIAGIVCSVVVLFILLFLLLLARQRKVQELLQQSLNIQQLRRPETETELAAVGAFSLNPGDTCQQCVSSML